MPSIAGIGEAMGELRLTPDGGMALAYAGDVLNTMAYVAMLGGTDWSVRFVSATGTDPVSVGLAKRCSELGVEHLFHEDPARPLGLYLISVDSHGERSFTYWRSNSPACQMIRTLTDMQLGAITRSDYVFLSGITLAILDEGQRNSLVSHLRETKAYGAKVVFDPNYRARLWESVEAAQTWTLKLYELSDIVFPGVEDEGDLFGQATVETILARPELRGAAEVVVKAGKAGAVARVCDESIRIAFDPPERAVDTTAAGDGFNAGWLTARSAGMAPAPALSFASRTARAIASSAGAIIPADFLPTLPA